MKKKHLFKISDILNSAAGKLPSNIELLTYVSGEIELESKKRSKFGNVIVQQDGITFDSTGEYNRWTYLKLFERQGLIKGLRHHVYFELNPGGLYTYGYEADFVYWVVGEGICAIVVEDFKGSLTSEYKRKRRLMKKIYGIKIHETSYEGAGYKSAVPTVECALSFTGHRLVRSVWKPGNAGR